MGRWWLPAAPILRTNGGGEGPPEAAREHLAQPGEPPGANGALTSEGNNGLKLWINHLWRHGGPPPIQLGIEQVDEVSIAGEVVFKGAAPIIESAGGPAGEGRSRA